MKHYNHSNTATLSTDRKSKGSQAMILLVIGAIGIAGLIYVLNANSNKSAFSESRPETVTTTVAQN